MNLKSPRQARHRFQAGAEFDPASLCALSGVGIKPELTQRRYSTGAFEVSALVREGGDPPIVLFHGAAGNALGWLPNAAGLGQSPLDPRRPPRPRR